MSLIPAENCQISLDLIEKPAIFTSSSPDETFTLGKNIAPLLEKGSIVALYGPLGAGKTCLAKGIGEGFGVKEELTSPTYTIISEYEANLPLYHIDAYRLRGNDDFSAIGGEEIINGEGVYIIEWSDRIEESIPDYAIRINIQIIEDNIRRIHILKGKK